jgi:hypothetical protein
MLARNGFRGWRRFAVWLAAGGLIVSLESSCAYLHGIGAKAKAAAAAAATVPAQPNGGGATSGRFITRASVDQSGEAGPTRTAGPTGASGAASPGSELVEHALAGSESDAGGTVASVNGAGGNGVPVAAAERRVGVVRVIGAHGRFVLIETTTGLGGVPLGAGQELRCRGAAAGGGVETATLKVSPERQAPYLVADVVAGIPQIGDVAYFAVPAKR